MQADKCTKNVSKCASDIRTEYVTSQILAEDEKNFHKDGVSYLDL